MAAIEGADDSPSLGLWRLTVGYAAVLAIGWLTVGMFRLFQWRSAQSFAADLVAQGQPDAALSVHAVGGSWLVDLGYAAATALLFGFAAIAVSRRTWNAWDYATVTIGFMSALSLIFLCAAPRLMFFIPFTSFPMLGLLYSSGTKSACGVPIGRPSATPEAPPVIASRDDVEREIARERMLITQLMQNLDVFEVERGISTDEFMRRYADGREEESADNAEWFSIARAVRRHRENLQQLQEQLAALPK